MATKNASIGRSKRRKPVSDAKIIEELVLRQQSLMINRVVRLLKARYRTQHTYDGTMLTFRAWLVNKGLLEETFNKPYTLGERKFRAHEVVRAAEGITLGASALRGHNLDWFIKGLEQAFDNSIIVTLVRRPHEKEYRQLTLKFEADPSYEHPF